jgi:uncharacterized membrane protein YdjX (TVP38/TMEM64 family)
VTRLTAVVAVVAALVITGYATGAATMTTHGLREWVQCCPRLAPVVFIGLFVLLNTIGLPVPILVTAGGNAFGMFEGATVTLAAMWVTACLQFLLARRLGGHRLRQRLAAHFGRFGSVLERRGVLAVAAGRLLPGPFSELNMAAGLTPVAFQDFAVGTLVGCAPKAVAWSIFGASAF